jgi:uncharacterized protein with von Willebrand factor type A (vWA) domain
MDNSSIMSMLDRQGDLLNKSSRPPTWQRAIAQYMRQTGAVYEVHDKEVLPLMESNLMHGNNVWMVQAPR